MVNNATTRRARPTALPELISQLFERVRRLENTRTVRVGTDWTLTQVGNDLVATNHNTGATTTVALG